MRRKTSAFKGLVIASGSCLWAGNQRLIAESLGPCFMFFFVLFCCYLLCSYLLCISNSSLNSCDVDFITMSVHEGVCDENTRVYSVIGWTQSLVIESLASYLQSLISSYFCVNYIFQLARWCFAFPPQLLATPLPLWQRLGLQLGHWPLSIVFFRAKPSV